jgi:rubrerythrin
MADKKFYYCERCHGVEFKSEDGTCPKCHSNEETYMYDEWYECYRCHSMFTEPDINERGIPVHYVVRGDHDAYGYEPTQVCPYCGSTRIEKHFREDFEE